MINSGLLSTLSGKFPIGDLNLSLINLVIAIILIIVGLFLEDQIGGNLNTREIPHISVSIRWRNYGIGRHISKSR